MWNVPQEIEDQKEIASQAFGNVLVAGYGLGLVQKYLLDNPQVQSILTVEILPDVLDVCREKYGELFGDVVICDFYDFASQKKFDVVIGDVWESVSKCHLDDYVRFKKKAEEFLKQDGKILGWGMDYMEYLLIRKDGN